MLDNDCATPLTFSIACFWCTAMRLNNTLTHSFITCSLHTCTDLQRATGLVESAESDAKRLNRVLQLTGLSDPVYAEAYVTVRC